jgi:cob(I)alamin adenosyltransferase
MLLETTSSRLTKQAEGYDSSTKCLLKRINSNLVQAHGNAGSPDTNYNIYERKVDKLASRISELETNLELRISTTVDMHNLKQSILHSEENLKMIYNLSIEFKFKEKFSLQQ